LNAIAFMTANYIARETGWSMHGWGHGDRATNEAFASLETFGKRFAELLADVHALGFDSVDLWGAHLSPEWATDEHVSLALQALAARDLTVTTYATWVDVHNVDRVCELAAALGTTTVGAGFSGAAESLAPVLADHGVTLAIENHPERTPAEVLGKIAAGGERLAAAVDTGWWATQGYDPVQAIRELGAHVAHVHLKDVRAVGEPHETCRWGEGIVDVEACVRELDRIGYTGALTVEHEPEDHDPGAECAEMRAELMEWLR
jgi:sugar phosphate isomerase/epimerase